VTNFLWKKQLHRFHFMYHGRLFCEIQLMIRNNWPKIIFKRNWLQIFLGSSDLLFVWNLNLALFDDSCFWSLNSHLQGLSLAGIIFVFCLQFLFHLHVACLQQYHHYFRSHDEKIYGAEATIKAGRRTHIISVHLQPPWQLMLVCLIL